MYIGVDGGATKTTVALADKEGNITARVVGGPSSPRNMGVKESVENIYTLIKEVKEGEITSSFIALPAVEEEYRAEKERIIKMLQEKGLEGKIVVGSDQLSAFRAGTKEKEGVVLIAGTGAVAHGWKDGEAVCSSWGYLADEGSAFYIGMEAFRAVAKHLDGRGEKTKITEILFEGWKISSPEELRKAVYSDFMRYIPQISVFVDMAGDDFVAREILEKAAEELALSANTVVEKLNFTQRFPLVVSGGVFQSEKVYHTFKEKVSSLAEVSSPATDPVKGAVILATL